MGDILTITAIASAAGGFMGAFGWWFITKLDGWWARPQVIIEFGPDYPFRDTALLPDGQQSEFLRVRVKNAGREIAKSCKCHVRHISLNSGGRSTQLPSDELMLTHWVPQEAKATIMHIPPKLDFLADLVRTTKVNGGFKVVAVFNVLNRNIPQICEHVGDFELEIVVTGENFKTAHRKIRFRFEGNSLKMTPLN